MELSKPLCSRGYCHFKVWAQGTFMRPVPLWRHTIERSHQNLGILWDDGLIKCQPLITNILLLYFLSHPCNSLIPIYSAPLATGLEGPQIHRTLFHPVQVWQILLGGPQKTGTQWRTLLTTAAPLICIQALTHRFLRKQIDPFWL